MILDQPITIQDFDWFQINVVSFNIVNILQVYYQDGKYFLTWFYSLAPLIVQVTDPSAFLVYQLA